MNDDKTGGPAFPHSAVHVGDTGVIEAKAKGMTLRDYFAASAPSVMGDNIAALRGWPTDLPIGDVDGDDFEDSVMRRWKELTPVERAETEAKWSFLWADAMLAERAKPGGSR